MSIFDRFSRVWNDGQRGFGKESYNEAKSQGISDRQLNQALSGYRIGKIAQDNINRGMGANDIFSKYATIWDDNRLGLGKQGYEAARAAGVSNQDLLNSIGGSRVGRVALDRIRSGIDSERSAATKNAAVEEQKRQAEAMQKKFDTQMLNMQNQMRTQQETYLENIAQMSNTMNANMNPNTRESVLGVKGAGSDSSNTAKLNRQGMKGSFARTGLRIKSLNI